MDHHCFFHCFASKSNQLAVVIEQVKAIRRLLQLTMDKVTTIQIRFHQMKYNIMTQCQSPVPAVVIDFSGLQIIGTSNVKASPEQPVTILQRLQISNGANISIHNLHIVNNCNEIEDLHQPFTHLSGITLSDHGTVAKLFNCKISNRPLINRINNESKYDAFDYWSRTEAHGLVVINGARVETDNCMFEQNGKSGIFVRGLGSQVTVLNGDLNNNQDYGGQVERSGLLTLLGHTKVHHNKWYGLGCYGRGSIITIASLECIVAENTNDSYGSKYGYVKEHGVIQLLCE